MKSFSILHIPPLLWTLVAITSAESTREPELAGLFDASDAAQITAWRPVHDVVMGGVSRGRVVPGDGTARFEGQVSLENNGGFASFRLSRRLPDLTGYDGFRLRVRGDGQVYKLSLRTSGSWDGVSWQAPFATTANAWTDVYLAFEELTPTWRGRLVGDAGPFDPTSIQQTGILIADKQEGPFALDLSSISAWKAGSESLADRARSAQHLRTKELGSVLLRDADGSELSSALRKSERVLVVSTPRGLDERSALQLGHLLARSGELADRELRTVQLMGSDAGRIAGRTLTSDQVAGLRERWKLPVEQWIVALVGKDGEVKSRWSSIVDPERVFELIDTMPMRKQEVRERVTHQGQ